MIFFISTTSIDLDFKYFDVPPVDKIWIPNLTNFLIALRSEDNIDILKNNFPFNYEIISGDKLDLSSTTLRNKLKEKNTEISDLPLEILTYIKENNLY